LTFPGGIVDNLRTFGINPVINKQEDITLPGAIIPEWSYAKSI
jgi:hypothetical protein